MTIIKIFYWDMGVITMTDYNYILAMENDIRDYIENECDLMDYDDMDNAYDDLYDRLLMSDTVTGNASGSYTFSTYKAEEYLCHNMELLINACYEFGQALGDAVERGAEYCDVTIRCHLLGSVLYEVLEELNDKYDYWE